MIDQSLIFTCDTRHAFVWKPNKLTSDPGTLEFVKPQTCLYILRMISIPMNSNLYVSMENTHIKILVVQSQ